MFVFGRFDTQVLSTIGGSGLPSVLNCAALFDCFPFDPFSLQQDDFTSSDIDVARRQVFQALMAAVVIVVIDEVGDRQIKFTGACRSAQAVSGS